MPWRWAQGRSASTQVFSLSSFSTPRGERRRTAGLGREHQTGGRAPHVEKEVAAVALVVEVERFVGGEESGPRHSKMPRQLVLAPADQVPRELGAGVEAADAAGWDAPCRRRRRRRATADPGEPRGAPFPRGVAVAEEIEQFAEVDVDVSREIPDSGGSLLLRQPKVRSD